MHSVRTQAAIRKAEDDFEERLLAELLRRFSAAGQSALTDEVMAAIAAQNLARVVELLNLRDFSLDPAELGDILAAAARRTGEASFDRLRDAAASRGAAAMPQGFINMSFTLIDQNVVRYAERRAAELVVEITETMRQTIREHIVTAVRDGITPQQTARNLARIIPLHTRYARAVVRREGVLYDQFVKAGMSPKRAATRAAQQADRYAAKLTRARARTIARTEIMTASNYGQLEGYRNAMESGLITNAATGKYMVTKEWITATDERVCPVCGPLHEKQVDWAEPFPNGVMIPPAHPNCRCSYNVIDHADQFDYDGAGTAEEEYADLRPLVNAQMRFEV